MTDVLWWQILLIVLGGVAVWFALSAVLYKPFFKRFYDVVLSGVALIVFSPLLLLLCVLVRIKLGAPVTFRQLRPGKHGKIFRLHKFRTMTSACDAQGNLLPDEQRLTRFGSFLRKTSLDELPELWDIFRGKMSIVGPRPLLVQYLPLYNEEQRRRHDVRPGLTGLAQVNGRNAIGWEEKFRYDIKYVQHVTFFGDIKILFQTVGKVFKRSGISQEGQATMEYFTGNKEYNVLILSAGRRVELVNCFKNARDKLGINGKVYAADMNCTAPALYFADEKEILPPIASDGYIRAIIDICKKRNIALIVPTIDTELEILAAEKSKIESETNARVSVSDYESVNICCDKVKTAEYFSRHGFGVPKVISAEDIALKNYTFPLFIKPANGSSSINTYKVNNEKELNFFAEYVSDPIVQECVSGKEYTVDCFSDFDGNVISVVPRIRLATRGGEVLKGKVDKNPAIIQDVKKLIESFGFIGQITVQCFLCDNGSIKYIEINPRFGGGAPMSIGAGADSCENLYRLLRGEKLEYNENWEDGVIFSRFDGSVRVSG